MFVSRRIRVARAIQALPPFYLKSHRRLTRSEADEIRRRFLQAQRGQSLMVLDQGIEISQPKWPRWLRRKA